MSEALTHNNSFEPQKSVSPVPLQPEAPLLELIEDSGAPGIIESNRRSVSQWITAVKRTGQTALVTIEITPGVNEGIRGALFAASEVITHGNPLMAGAVAGLSTFAIEAAGGAAGISLKETPQGDMLTSKVEATLTKLKVPAELSKTTKLWTTFMGGTNVGLILENRQNPNRTPAENQRYNYITSAWLGGTLAVAGALSAEGINIGIDNPEVTGGITGALGLAAAGRWLKKRLGKTTESAAFKPHDVLDNYKKYAFGLTTDSAELQQAAELEERVWTAKDFGSLDEYADHIAHSRTFTAFENTGECSGILRLFEGTHNVPPFMDMHVEDKETGVMSPAVYIDETQKAAIIAGTKAGTIEEVGTLARREGTPKGEISKRLYRLAYRDARARGIEQWGIIMEPERVAQMNSKFGFTFRQISKAGWYQGGDCAAFIMDLNEVDRSMSKKHPLSYFWFVKKQLNS